LIGKSKIFLVSFLKFVKITLWSRFVFVGFMKPGKWEELGLGLIGRNGKDGWCTWTYCQLKAQNWCHNCRFLVLFLFLVRRKHKCSASVLSPKRNQSLKDKFWGI
jgi:hypothetical protein